MSLAHWLDLSNPARGPTDFKVLASEVAAGDISDSVAEMEGTRSPTRSRRGGHAAAPLRSKGADQPCRCTTMPDRALKCTPSLNLRGLSTTLNKSRESSFRMIRYSRGAPSIRSMQTLRSNGPICFSFDRVVCHSAFVFGFIGSFTSTRIAAA